MSVSTGSPVRPDLSERFQPFRQTRSAKRFARRTIGLVERRLEDKLNLQAAGPAPPAAAPPRASARAIRSRTARRSTERLAGPALQVTDGDAWHAKSSLIGHVAHSQTLRTPRVSGCRRRFRHFMKIFGDLITRAAVFYRLVTAFACRLSRLVTARGNRVPCPRLCVVRSTLGMAMQGHGHVPALFAGHLCVRRSRLSLRGFYYEA